jgi:selenide,water dikinase
MRALFFFTGTRDVIRAETLCRSKGLPIEVVPVPREFSSECGMCLSVPADRIDEISSCLQGGEVRFQRPPEQNPPEKFDLLTTVEYGGCSAKLPADLLAKALQGLAPVADPRLLVGVDTCDDAGVYQLSDEQALIVTTDFFPPICADAYEFGQIAAANALSDVFAMGGTVLLAMNLVMFPAQGIPLQVLHAMLAGGQDKVREAGGLTVGGHTIADHPPKYGLAVTGLVHPGKVMTNALGKPGECLILTKPLGTGVLVAGHRLGEAGERDYQRALATMKQLNRSGAEIAGKYGVRCATDITGFGLLGHALHIAKASHLTVEFDVASLPVLPGVMALLRAGCIPGGAFCNQAYIESHTVFAAGLPYEQKMLCLDPQTSGGLLFSIGEEHADTCLGDLRAAGCPAAVVGRLSAYSGAYLRVR